MSEVRGDPRVTVLIAYGLFLLGLVNGLTTIAGVILLYVTRDAARGTLWDSHYRNLIVVFWAGIAVAALFALLILPALSVLFFSLVSTDGNPPASLIGSLAAGVPLMGLAGLLFLIWYLYRTISGLVRALDGLPY
jgi:uncharacterized membrane protein